MIKWLPDVAPTDRAVDVAVRCLRIRLDAVRGYLRRAVKEPDEPENFHQFRVWSRRAEAALDVFADLLPRRGRRRLRRMLGQLRRAAGRVRDCDVFGKRTAGPRNRWPAGLLSERERAVRKLVRRYDRLGRGKKLRRRIDRLLDRLMTRNADLQQCFVDRARAVLWPLVSDFFRADPGDSNAQDALHRFRLAGKDLRYAMELLAPAFAPAFRDEVYPLFGLLQEKLGLVNDLSAARQRLEDRLAREGDPAELSDLRRRVAAVGEDLARAGDDFRRSWTPEARAALRARFAALLGPLPIRREA